MRTIGSLALRGLAVALVTLAAVRASAAQQSGAFEVSLPAQPLQLEILDSGGRTLGETVGSITAFADGIECVSVDVSNLEEDAILQLGLQGQAAECSKAGAIVNFQQDDGIWLSNWFTLE